MDSIIYTILSKISILYKKCIEFGGNGINCITSNLIFNHNFNGLLFDLNEQKIQLGIEYYKAHNKLEFVTFVNGLITLENLKNIIISIPKFNNNIDILVININGNDYWILKEILKYINPRIIIIKYLEIIPHDLALVIPYYSNFNYKEFNGIEYYSASLKAYKLLLDNYKIIYKYNNFIIFLHKTEKLINEIDIIYNKNFYHKYDKIKNLPFINIEK